MEFPMVEQFQQRRNRHFFGGNYFGQCTHDGSPNSDSILKKRIIHFWKIFGTGRTITAIGGLLLLLFFEMPATLTIPARGWVGGVHHGRRRHSQAGRDVRLAFEHLVAKCDLFSGWKADLVIGAGKKQALLSLTAYLLSLIHI